MGLAHGMPVWGTGGKGGGRVKLQAFDVVSVRGTVEANGERAYAKTYTPVVEWSGAAISGGRGSGGSIQLIAKRIVGNGNVNANGGGVRDSNDRLTPSAPAGVVVLVGRVQPAPRSLRRERAPHESPANPAGDIQVGLRQARLLEPTEWLGRTLVESRKVWLREQGPIAGSRR